MFVFVLFPGVVFDEKSFIKSKKYIFILRSLVYSYLKLNKVISI